MFQPYILMKACGYTFALDGMDDCVDFIRCMDENAQRSHIKSLMKEGGFDESGKLVDTFYDILRDLLRESNCVLRFRFRFSTDEEKKVWRDKQAYHAQAIDAQEKLVYTGHIVERRDQIRDLGMFCMEIEPNKWLITRRVDENTSLITSLFVTHGAGMYRPERSELCSDEKLNRTLVERAHRFVDKHAIPPVESAHSLIWDCTSREVDDLEFQRYVELFQ